MSLQHESDTVQTVNQTEDSPPRMTISRLSVMVEKMKAALERSNSNWISVLHTVSRWVVGLSLILALSVFTYIALYSSLMPREVQLTNNIIIWIVIEAVTVAGFRFTKKTSTSSSATVLRDREPAVIPTWPSSWTPGETSWWWGSPTPSLWSWSSRTLLITRWVADWLVNSVLPQQFHPGAWDVHVLSENVRERRRTIISHLSLQSSPVQVHLTTQHPSSCLLLPLLFPPSFSTTDIDLVTVFQQDYKILTVDKTEKEFVGRHCWGRWRRLCFVLCCCVEPLVRNKCWKWPTPTTTKKCLPSRQRQ